MLHRKNLWFGKYLSLVVLIDVFVFKKVIYHRFINSN